MNKDTVSQAFFEEIYQRETDPWTFATSAYEQSRYSAIVASLDGRRFRRTFEPGCSIGILTAQLAAISAQVEAIDISAIAAGRACEQCGSLDNVTVRQGKLPGDIPAGTFDLIVLSEIGYYFQPETLTAIAAELVRRLDSGGVLLAAHWLGVSPDHLLNGDQVHHLLDAVPGVTRTHGQRNSMFRINHWTKS